MKVFLLTLLALVIDGGPPEGPRLFRPSTVRSANGWELQITPYDEDGYHGAGYQLTRVVRESKPSISWKGNRPYTLRDPIVSDRGWTYGAAYVNTNSKSAPGAATGWIVALDDDGKARIEDKVPISDSAGTWIGPMFPFEVHDRLLVRTGTQAPHPWDEVWWIYDLTNGKRDVTRRPFPTIENESGYPTAYTIVEGVVAVRGTPLVLGHGLRRSSDRPGDWNGARDQWRLCDLRGTIVWSLDDVDDPAIADLGTYSVALRQRRDTVASSTVGQFDLVRARTKERLTFLAQEDAQSHSWIVKETARVNWPPRSDPVPK